MKKIIWIDALRTIRGTFSKFIALFAIVALGIAFFVGVSASAPIMGQSVDIYNDENKLLDFQIYGNYGFDEADLNAMQRVEDIESVMGIHFIDAIATSEEKEQLVRVTSYDADQEINQLTLVEGRLPEHENECLAEEAASITDGFAIGDKVRVLLPSDEIEEALNVTEFTVVGLATSPDYLATERGESTLGNRTLESFLMVPESVFESEVYGTALLLAKGASSFNGYSDEYSEYIEPIKAELESFVDTQQEVREAQIKENATKEYKEGLAEYEEGVKEYEDGQKAYEDGRITYENEIADGEKALADALHEIELGEGELDSGRAKLQNSQNELDTSIKNGLSEIAEGERLLQIAQEELNRNAQAYEESKPQLLQQLAELESQRTTLEAILQGLQDIHAGINQVEAGQVKLQEELKEIQESQLTEPEKAAAIAAVQEQQALLELQLDALYQQYDVVIAMLQGQGIADEAQLQAVLGEIRAGEQEIRGVMGSTEQQLVAGQSQIDSEREAVTVGRTELESKKVAAQQEIDKGYATLRENETKLINAKADYQQGVSDLEKGRQEGQQELDEAQAELADAKVDLDEAQVELEDGKAEIDDLEAGEWTVLDREMHSSSVQYKDTISQMEAIAAVFPIFFFLVAALVCLTTMTRMVDEQRGQMGILRALGYSNFDCVLKFLFYSGTATILGGIAGTIVGMLVFPPIIYNTWGLLFELPKLRYEMPVNYIVIANVLFLLLMCGTTFSVAWSQLKEVPSQILRPKAPKMGKTVILEKIGFLWKRMSFTSKVTARNLIRYKRRFFMTVVGISGCTALLVSGFGIRESVSDIISLQYEEITRYDGSLRLLEGIPESEKKETLEEVKSIAGIEVAKLVPEYDFIVSSENGKEDYVAQIQIVEDTTAHQDFNLIRERDSKTKLELTDDTVIISEKLSELLEVEVGDSIGIENQDERIEQFIIGGIHERYISHEVFLTQNAYKASFGEEAESNTIQLVLEEDAKGVREKLDEIDGIENSYLFESTIDDLTKRIEGINVIVYLIIVCAAVLAFIVLGNLTNINISERQRELATLKVLGFTNQEVNVYMFKENMVLTFFGTLLGLLLGTTLHRFIITLVEMEFVMFIRETTFISFALAAVITFVFSFTVNAIVTRKLRKIQMVESLKSVE